MADTRTSESLVGLARLVTRMIVDANGRRRPLALVGAFLATTLLEGIVLLLVVPALTTLTGDHTYLVPHLAIRLTETEVMVSVVAVVVLRAATSWCAGVLGAELRLRTTDRLRLDALEAVLGARWSYLLEQRRSRWVQGLTTEVQRASAAIDVLLQLVVSGVLMVVLAVVALVVSPAVAAAAIVVVGLLVLAVRHDVRRLFSLGAALGETLQRFGGMVSDSLAAVRVVRSHDAAGAWLADVGQEAQATREATLAVVRRTTRTGVVLAAAGVLGLLGLAYVGTRAGVPATRLVALVLVSTRLLGVARGIVSQAQEFAYLGPALGDLDAQTRQARAAGEAAPDPGGTVPDQGRDTSSSRPPTVVLTGVGYGYGSAAPALDDVHATFRAGELNVVVGRSGAGKSTLLDLVLGLLDPDSGRIDVDGHPRPGLSAWRRRLAYVPQETVLVPGSVRHNLQWSAGHHASDDDLWQALDVADAADVVRRLPDGLDTHLRETAQLSGGERQRLNLARAVVRRPELLILDEATSSLDPRTEDRVLRNVMTLGCTVILATHRASATALASTVLDLDAARPGP